MHGPMNVKFSTHSFYRDKYSEGKIVREEYLSYSIPRELEMKNSVTFCYKRSFVWNSTRLLWMCICAELKDMNLQLIIKGKFWVNLCLLYVVINAQSSSLLLGIVTVSLDSSLPRCWRASHCTWRQIWRGVWAFQWFGWVWWLGIFTQP